VACGGQALERGRRVHCRAPQSGLLICDDGLGCGIGGSESVTEFFIAAGRFGLEVPTPNRLLTASTGTTALTNFTGAISSGGGPLGALSGLAPTSPSGRGPTWSSGPMPIALARLAPAGGPTSSSGPVPIALAGRGPASVPTSPRDPGPAFPVGDNADPIPGAHWQHRLS
jgi:hypothetical protein